MPMTKDDKEKVWLMLIQTVILCALAGCVGFFIHEKSWIDIFGFSMILIIFGAQHLMLAMKDFNLRGNGGRASDSGK